jgi:teichuronic acid biosynthesis glycosyltransferase TuaG
MNTNINPLVSVIIPTYNHSKYLSRILSSVFYQTYKRFEIIVVDNHSTDKTSQILDAFSSPLLRVIKISNDGCIAKSRNIGALNAKGEWIAFLDSDDYWAPTKLEDCMAGRESHEVLYHKMLCYEFSKSKSIFISGQLGARDISKNPFENLRDKGPALTTSAIMVKKTSFFEVDGFDENPNLIGGEDFDLWLRLAKNRCKFKMINKFLGFYLVGGVHITSAYRTKKIIEYLASKHLDGSIKYRPNWMHKSMLASLLKTHSYQEFTKYLLQIYRELSLANNLIVLYLILRTLILRKVFSIRTIN